LVKTERRKLRKENVRLEGGRSLLGERPLQNTSGAIALMIETYVVDVSFSLGPRERYTTVELLPKKEKAREILGGCTYSKGGGKAT